MHPVLRRCTASFGLTALLIVSVASADVKDNGLNSTSTGGLAELQGKVSGRGDVTKTSGGPELLRFDTEADGTYFFTTAGHPAHAFALYCGEADTGSNNAGPSVPKRNRLSFRA